MTAPVDPPRLLDDSSVAPDAYRDLARADRVWTHPTDPNAALARFTASVHAGVGIATWLSAGGAALVVLGLGVAAWMQAEPTPVASTPTLEAAPLEPPPVVAPVETAPPSSPTALAELSEVEAPRDLPREISGRVRRPTRTRIEPAQASIAETISETQQPAPPPLAPPPTAASPLDELTRETALMNRERHEAQHGDPAQAVALAAEAQREFPHGHFLVERDAWRLVALDRLGRRDEVRAGATRFLERYGGAPEVEMVRRLLER